MEKRLELRGTHGTSRSKAESIQTERSFKPTNKDGHAGPGIYFWAINGSDDSLARHLACCWWKNYLDSGRYAKDAKKDCAVVHAIFSKPEEPEYYDASTQKFREEVFSLAQSLSMDPKLFDMPAATATVIGRIEKHIGKKILVLKAMVKTPKAKGIQSLVAAYQGLSDVYVVRDGGENLFKKIEILQ